MASFGRLAGAEGVVRVQVNDSCLTVHMFAALLLSVRNVIRARDLNAPLTVQLRNDLRTPSGNVGEIYYPVDRRFDQNHFFVGFNIYEPCIFISSNYR